MMASLTLVRLQSIKMDLPTATAAHRDFKPDIITWRWTERAMSLSSAGR